MFCKILSSIARLPYRLRRSIRKRVGFRHYSSYKRGGVNWLQSAEQHFGGMANNIYRTVISKNDPETQAAVEKHGMKTKLMLHNGGDRMLHLGYAKHYAKHLAKFLQKENLIIVECGILRGSGLAMWSVLFPTAKIIGLDIDPSNCQNNLEFLKQRGAFKNGVNLFQFDQLDVDATELKNFLGEQKIDIFIDDGLHTENAIMDTLRVIYPLLNKEHVCFIEDNSKIITEIKNQYPNSRVVGYHELTVIENK